MVKVVVEKKTYTVDSPYQWDVEQVLEVHGLSLSTTPEVHFAHDNMRYAIVRQATMDAAGVIRAGVPSSLLQKASRINAYICVREGDTFQSLHKIVIPVNARSKPGDYEYKDEYVLKSYLDIIEIDVFDKYDENVVMQVKAFKKIGEKWNEVTISNNMLYLETAGVFDFGCSLVQSACVAFLCTFLPRYRICLRRACCERIQLGGKEGIFRGFA